MKMDIQPEDITYPRGLEISVDGFMGDLGSVTPSQVYMEVYEGKLRVHVWARNTHDPEASVDIAPLPSKRRPRRKSKARDGEQKLRSVVLTLQYCLETFEHTCQCGQCDPCTRGRSDIRKAIRIVEDSILSSKHLSSHS
jgi:hypothetical protein